MKFSEECIGRCAVACEERDKYIRIKCVCVCVYVKVCGGVIRESVRAITSSNRSINLLEHLERLENRHKEHCFPVTFSQEIFIKMSAASCK